MKEKRMGREMYLDPIHWVMDNSGLRLLKRKRKREKETAREEKKRSKMRWR